MNSLQRYQGMLDGKPVDIVPRTPILMQFAAEHIGTDYAKFASDYRVLVRANEACAKDFGFDQLSCISDPYRETQGFGSRIEYVPDGPPRSSHPLQNTRDLSTLIKPSPLLSVRMKDRVDAARLYKQQNGSEYSILGWIEGPAAEAADLRTPMNFLMDVMDDEKFACELMDLCVEVGISFARAQIEAGADTIGIGDAIASQLSPDLYERLVQPREMKLVKAIRDMGAYTKLHICGNITHLLPGIADLNVSILDVDHMVSLSAARKAVGQRVAIAGNIDPVTAVQRGTPASIREAIRSAYVEVGNPYIVNAGCEVPSGTPPANLKALCDAIADNRLKTPGG
ncbi:MAG: uroporphyrinogen decarboxylase family protein [bacterium]